MEYGRHIFISHTTQEAEIAQLLKDLFLRAFGPSVTVFVSSDTATIGTGTRQFDAIIDGLGRASVFVVLLSEFSVERRWINFETGIAFARERWGLNGPNLKLIPLAIRSQQPNVGSPLNQLQVRALNDDAVVKDVLKDIAKHLGISAKPVGRTIFRRKLDAIEQSLQERTIHLEAVVSPNSRVDDELVVDLKYNGRQALRLERVWVAIPHAILHRTLYERRRTRL